MNMKASLRALVFALASVFSASANAWFFIFPIPNFAKPGPLQVIIDALEKSNETRAVATASENKVFGSKYWVWGKYSGEVSQEVADQYALDQCENSLRTEKQRREGGQPVYDFGDKKCELHPFTPNDGPKIAEAKRIVAEEEKARQNAIEEAKRIAAEDERKRIATEEQQKKIAGEDEARRVATATEAKRLADEGEAKQSEANTSKRAEAKPSPKQAASSPQKPDFNVEANKSARILGCKPSTSRVTGVEGGNIQYSVDCENSKTLNLSCDPSGLCLQKSK